MTPAHSSSTARQGQASPTNIVRSPRKNCVFVLERRWHKLGQTLNPEDSTDAQGDGAVVRITRGNFRLIDRLFTQVEGHENQ